MVKLHIKRGDESQFLCETTVEVPVAELLVQLVRLYNGRHKVDRLCQGRWALIRVWNTSSLVDIHGSVYSSGYETD